jgi:hypothetical protein
MTDKLELHWVPETTFMAVISLFSFALLNLMKMESL